LKVDQLPGALRELAGELHADLAAAAPLANQWLQGSIERQLESGVVVDATGAARPGEAMWMDASANRGQWNADDQASRFTENHTEVAVGFELFADEPYRAGFGFAHSLADVSTDAGSGSIESNSGFFYGQYSAGAVIVDGMVGAGGGLWEASRSDPLGLTAEGLRSGGHDTSTVAGAGLRVPLPVDDFLIQPYARTLWQRLKRGSFDEGPALDALSAPSFSVSGFRSLAGVSMGSANGAPLAASYTYRLDVGVGHDDGDAVHPVITEILAGNGFTVESPDVGRTFAQASLSGTARIGKRSYVYLGVADEVRSGKGHQEELDLGARALF
jgi:outer membrane autotransporter protein